jgi:hypothetical protein
MVTKLSPIPEELADYLRCGLLHTKTPIMTEKGIRYVCLTCKAALQEKNGKK